MPISSCESIADALRVIGGDEEEDDEPPPEREPGDDTEEVEGEKAADAPPVEANGHVAPILCERCQRVGKTKNCAMCAEARRGKNGKKKKPSSQPAVEEDAPLDDFGNPIPKSCRDVYCDEWVQESRDLLAAVSEQVRLARLMEGMTKRVKRLPFFKGDDFKDGVGFVIDYLDKLIEHLEQNRPAGVCPSCQGKKCPDCRMSGLVPKAVYEELKAR